MQYSHCQQISAGKDRAKIRIIKKQRGERVGKRVAYHLVLCHWFNKITVVMLQKSLNYSKMLKFEGKNFTWTTIDSILLLLITSCSNLSTVAVVKSFQVPQT